MSRVLVLRPEPGASATVKQARDLGLDAIAIPLFEIERVEWHAPVPSGFDGLLLTSANAVRHGGDELQALRGLSVYTVGEATAEAAREAGFDIAATGDAGVDRLLGSLEPDLKLLHLCGADRREPDGAPQEITRVTVYRAMPVEPPDFAAAQGSIALVHSPLAGRRFAELVTDRAEISIAAISKATAEAVGEGWRTLETAGQPTDAALLALAARLCNNSAPQ
jgi:uroporphyrinogen-III synthase